MRVLSISVTNYRSITQARKLDLRDFTVLVGPNNEGKSNILRALVLSLTILAGEGRRTVKFRHRYREPDRRFDWERDFPVHLQSSKPKGQSRFILDFELSEQEIDEFREEVGSKLTGSLPIELGFGQAGVEFHVRKKGPGAKTMSRKAPMIARFLAKRLDFEYIPAVRTADAAEAVVERMVSAELARIEEDPKFLDALKIIEDLQAPILKEVSASIHKTLREFLPAVKSVKVEIAPEDRIRGLRRCSIIVDDGSATLLQYKGDGVQSLAALCLMRHSSISGAREKNIIIAIEEPESHLHPDGIHALRSVLRDIASKHQLVIATHCPLFVDRGKLANNVIVRDKRAKPAGSIQEIREALGVRASDNLRHAELVLLVEGEEDRSILSVLLPQSSKVISEAMDSGVLALESIGGSGNLSYRALEMTGALCQVHAFVDDDAAGHKAAERARVDGALSDGDINYCRCDGLRESEVEDLIEPSAYAHRLRTEWRVDIANPKFKSKRKWSERMQAVFLAHGKDWSERIQGDVKRAVAETVSADPGNALHQKRRTAFDGLVNTLEQRIAEVSLGS